MVFPYNNKIFAFLRLSLWWQSFSRSHFAKSPFDLDGPHPIKRWHLLLQKQNLQLPFGPSEPLSPNIGQLFYAITMPVRACGDGAL